MTTGPVIPRRSAAGPSSGGPPAPLAVRHRAELAAVVAGVACLLALQVLAAPVAVAAAVAGACALAWVLLPTHRSTEERHGPA